MRVGDEWILDIWWFFSISFIALRWQNSCIDREMES